MRFKTYSYLVICLILIFTGISIYYAAKLKFDYNFENFFPKGDPDLEYFLDYREKFGYDNDYILLGLNSENGVFKPNFLKKADSLTNYIAGLRNVVQVTSPTTVSRPVVEGFGVFNIPYLHLDRPENFAQDSAIIYSTPELIGTLFSEDAKAVSLLIQTSDNLTKLPSDTLISQIEGKLAELQLNDYHLAGKAIAQSVFVQQMQEELVVFMSASIVLVIIVLFVTFRSLFGVLVPLLVVLLAVLWGLGFIGMFGKPLDLMSVLLPSIIFVVGMSDVVHIMAKYISETGQGKDKLTALKITLKEVGIATFLTSVTTAVGFLTLLSTSIVPVRNFGAYTAVSVCLAYILAFTLLPALLFLLNKPVSKPYQKVLINWPVIMHRFLAFTLRFRKQILTGSVAFTILFLLGISQIQIDATMLDDLAEDDPIRQDFAYFEHHFSGVRPFDMHLITGPDHDIFDLEVLQEIEQIENYLLNDYGLNFISSPVMLVKSANRSFNGGSNDYFKLPESESELNKITRRLKSFAKRDEFRRIFTQDLQEGSLSGKMNDIGSARALVRNDSLQQFINQNINPNVLQTKLTGSALLLDRNNEYLTVNMMQGLLIAFFVVSCIVGLLFRSWKMIVLALIPNMLPLLFIGAFMGFGDINLKVSTSIIFTIAFGIAVDDTIHFISKLKLELLSGKSLLYAIKRTFISTGKAIIMTTIILVAGFLTLILSSFDGTYYIGLLISLTLVFAVIADLLLLPVLLVYFYKKEN